jgi:site-specific recombinase XerD
MSKKHSQSEFEVTDDLETYFTEFVATLAKAGYAKKTVRDKKRLIACFIRWLSDVAIEVEDVDETSVDRFLKCPLRRRYGHRTALRQFVEHLRVTRVVPRHLPKLSAAEFLLQRYVTYLRDRQGLSRYSIAVYSPLAASFVVAQRLPENAKSFEALAVRRYLLDNCRNRSDSCVRLLAAALRSFLRFCFLDGMTSIDHSTAVIPVRRRQFSAIPPLLTAEEIERVITAADQSTKRGRRDFAILLLLARLGLRASEIIALELDDIRWEAGEIVVRGKGNFHERLPLLADVGEALALYASEARGPSGSRRLFLRLLAPHIGLSQPSGISKIARNTLRRAGLLPAGRVGAHIFRHSLATRMIRHGASLAEISQVLRHRWTGTTRLYAKVDFETLRAVAQPWPNSEVER